MTRRKTTASNVPKLRFPELRNMGEWKEKKLGGIAKRITRKNKDIDVSRVLTNSAIDGIVDQRDYFDKDIANESNLSGYYIVEGGDFIYNPRISGSEPPNLSTQQIKDIKTFIPSEKEQQKIADCLSSLDELIATHTQKLDTLKIHKKGLMQQLFPAINEVTG